jgi:hypothetical protein
MAADPAVELVLGPASMTWTDMGGNSRDRRARARARAGDHVDDVLGHILLYAEQPQRRATLAGGAERRGDNVVGDLFRQRRGVDDHRIDAASLGDQRHDRRILGGERAVDRACHFGRAGEGDAGHSRIGHERGTDPAVARHELQRLRRDAGLVQEANRRGGDERRLLGGLRHHGVPPPAQRIK